MRLCRRKSCQIDFGTPAAALQLLNQVGPRAQHTKAATSSSIRFCAYRRVAWLRRASAPSKEQGLLRSSLVDRLETFYAWPGDLLRFQCDHDRCCAKRAKHTHEEACLAWHVSNMTARYVELSLSTGLPNQCQSPAEVVRAASRLSSAAMSRVKSRASHMW